MTKYLQIEHLTRTFSSRYRMYMTPYIILREKFYNVKGIQTETILVCEITEDSLKARSIMDYFYKGHKQKIRIDKFNDEQKRFYELVKSLDANRYKTWGLIWDSISKKDKVELNRLMDEAGITLFIAQVKKQ